MSDTGKTNTCGRRQTHILKKWRLPSRGGIALTQVIPRWTLTLPSSLRRGGQDVWRGPLGSPCPFLSLGLQVLLGTTSSVRFSAIWRKRRASPASARGSPTRGGKSAASCQGQGGKKKEWSSRADVALSWELTSPFRAPSLCSEERASKLGSWRDTRDPFSPFWSSEGYLTRSRPSMTECIATARDCLGRTNVRANRRNLLGYP